MAEGFYNISAWASQPSMFSIDAQQQLTPEYDISASELDSLLATQQVSTQSNVLQRLARRYPAGATFYASNPARPGAYRLIMRYQNGAWEHFDVDHGDDPGRFGAVPASDAEIARLPRATCCEVKEKDCAVCLESFEEGEELRKMTCPSSHGFHEKCIFKWLSVSRLCPLCRFALPADQEEEAEEVEL